MPRGEGRGFIWPSFIILLASQDFGQEDFGNQGMHTMKCARTWWCMHGWRTHMRTHTHVHTHTHTHAHTRGPGVEEGAVEQRAVVVVAYKVAAVGLPGARLGHLLVGDGDAVPGVVEVQQHHVKHQRRLPGNVTPWRGGREGGREGRIDGVQEKGRETR